MKKIALTQGQYALVDNADYTRLNQWKWCASWSEDVHSFYAVRGTQVNGRHVTVYMHREIFGLRRGDGKQVDHVACAHTLDNRRSNLRLARHSQQMSNQRRRSDNTSGYKGVTWVATSKRWQAQIQHEKKVYFLGTFAKVVDAHIAYCEAAKRLHGEFARII